MDYGKLYDDIREAIDTVHRDNSLKREVRKDIGRYIFKDPELGPALHKLRSGGKKLFLLTNSLWDYTDAVMRYLLDGVVPEYPSWRNYFDVVVTGAASRPSSPSGRPFLEMDATTEEGTRARARRRPWSGGKVYQGGNLPAFERMTGYRRGERALRRRPHLRRHPQVEEGVAVAHLHGGAGARGRDSLHRGPRRRRSTRLSRGGAARARGWTTR